MALVLLAALFLPMSFAEDSGIGGTSFRNLADHTMMLYWHSFSGEFKRQAQICGNGCSNGFQTYATHQFAWVEMTPDGQEPLPEEIVPMKWETISADQMVYVYTDETTKPSVQAELDHEMEFRARYYRENGFHWTGTSYPRPPPTLPMVNASFVGQKIVVPLPKLAHQYKCSVGSSEGIVDDEDDPVEQEYVSQCINGAAPAYWSTSQEGPGTLTLEVVSVRPRVFLIRNFLSDFEADYMVHQARPKLTRSTVGHGINAQVDNTRKSKSAWLKRTHSDIMDAVYRRIAAVTAIPEQLLWEHKNAENLNVLRYPRGGEYTPHYDWGPNGKVESRFLSGLLYLNTPLSGGGTSFPKAQPEMVTVPAAKGNYVFFYNLLEDGNGDVLSLHSGTMVEKGHKWVAPLWLWEPSVSGAGPHEFGDISKRPLQTIENSRDSSREL
eukprot:TRINITY_DN3077_c0_g1_i20.p1 TRINITY_DN3077_c0_g1~~TRINITY_DN3077_c0_g1_i20.p1  ORF type:complete len:438 (-),score=93.50 TRINITY_DN3077_c0_g1_i20:196-1509(-)